MRAAFGRAGLLGQGGRFARDSAAQPFTDGVPRTAKLPDGSFDAMLTGKANDLLVKPVAICTHTIQLKIAAMHPRKIGTARLAVRPSAAAAQGAPRSARPAAGELRARKPEPLAPMPPILRPHSTLCAALSSVPHSILLAAGGGHDVPSSSHKACNFRLLPLLAAG